MKNFKLSVVVPVYKEENGIRPFLERTEKVLAHIGAAYEIIFALDPSPDGTYDVIKEEMKRNKNIKLIRFSRRFGQPPSTLAGIFNCEGDACIVIDVDLQDPPELMEQMVSKWQEGYDVVYAQRTSRDGETALKKLIAATGYRVINYISSVAIPVDTGDYRLINRKVIEELKKLREHHGFLKGMVPFVGFKQVGITYHREVRAEGQGNYNRFLGSTRIGFNGLFCYSSKPLEYVTYAGVILSAVGGVFTFFSLLKRLFSKKARQGNGLLTSMLLFCTGGLVLCMGILGEYVTRIYDEVTDRPLYIIDEFDKNE